MLFFWTNLVLIKFPVSYRPYFFCLFPVTDSFEWFEMGNLHKNIQLRIHGRLLTILKISNKSVWSNVFWYVKEYIFWKCIQYTLHWDKIQMLKKFPTTKKKKKKKKKNGTKNTLFFLSRASWTHHRFTFSLWFLYELKHKVRLCVRFSIFVSVSFSLLYIFVNKVHKLR